MQSGKFVVLLLCFLFPIVKPTIVPHIGNDYFSSGWNLLRFPINVGIGSVGVNILGFHASAGILGGLISEQGKLGSIGGPHAEASTPFGQSAAAGVGVTIYNGSYIGYIYAEAQLGSKIYGRCLLLSQRIFTTVKILKWDECASYFNINPNTSIQKSILLN